MNSSDPHAIRQRDVRRRFDRAAATFDGADFVHRTTADGLLERLQPMLVETRQVLDLGCATGNLSRRLARRFRGSRVVSLDLSHAMLRRARKQRSRFARISELQADAAALPLKDASCDVVVCNLLLPWIADVPLVFGEVARVLRQEGLFAFAALGPDSLKELREAFGDGHSVFRFPDMHDIGDALVRAGLVDPVLDVDPLTVDYDDTAKLYRDLARSGGGNTLPGRRRSLTGKGRFRRADGALKDMMRDGTLSLTLELVYGHAFGGQRRGTSREVRFDVADIGRRGRAR